jgi:uncharacterized cupredoxin-like copper-binding protein
MTRLLAALLTVVLAACAGQSGTSAGQGEDHGAHEDADEAPASLEDAQSVTVTATEFAFEPQRIVVDGRANIVLVNEGEIEHEFDVDALGVHLHADAGESATGGIEGAEPGEYEVVCGVEGHEEAGMVATLVVEA